MIELAFFSFYLKVQQEILQKRREEKKATLEAVKKFKRGRGEKPSFLRGAAGEEEGEGESFQVAAESGQSVTGQGAGRKRRPLEKSKRRVMKVWCIADKGQVNAKAKAYRQF